jgi:uncharacterized protein (DUF2147 family)
MRVNASINSRIALTTIRLRALQVARASMAGICCRASLAVALSGMLALLPALAADPTGIWLNPKGSMRVRIAPCGAALCGVIVWMKEPNDPATGEVKTDKNNPDPGHRSRPLVGIDMLLGMKPSGTPGQWAGQVYLPGSGKTHDANLSLEGSDTLKIEGCAVGRLFCQSQNWTRAS